MQKSSLLLVNGLFSLLILLGSCSGKEIPKEQASDSNAKVELVEAETSDTIWMEPEVTKYTSWNWQMDTSFMKNSERIQLSLSIRNLNEQFKYETSWERDDTTFAKLLIGPQFEFSVVARTDKDQYILSKVLRKEDLISEDNSHFLTADSYTQFDFLGYHEKFKAILLRSFVGYPNTDRGVMEYVFVGLDGQIKKQITEGTAFDLCDIDPIPSPDGKTFCFCRGILHSDYRLVSVDRDTPLAGIFQLGNNYIIAVYMFEGKPPYSNMKVLGRNGTLQKSFPFEGILQEMSFSVLHCRLNNGNLVMFDDAQRQLFVFNADVPTQPDIIRFDTCKLPTESIKETAESYSMWSFRGHFDLYYLDGEFYLEEQLIP